MDEGSFVEWLKEDGAFVEKGEMVFVIEGDKAAQEVESFDAGMLYLPADAPKRGDTVKVGEVIGFLLGEGESPPLLKPARSEPRASQEAAPEAARVDHSRRVAGPAARRLARQLGIDLQDVPTPDPTGRVLSEDVRRAVQSGERIAAASPRRERVVASPRARRRASELGVDWRTLAGSGRRGRIRERDVLAFATEKLAGSASRVPIQTPGKRLPATSMRRTIAKRMTVGAHESAPVTLTTKADADQLVAFRAQLKAQFSDSLAPSYSDVLIKLVAMSLYDCPELNACWDDGAIFLFEQINVAIAVDTDEGLRAPVIPAADQRTLTELAAYRRALVDRARNNQLTHDELQGGTFTVTNLGAFDIDFFTPILNLPQSAILGIGRIVREPVVREDEVTAGYTLGLSLTFDHRVLDGAPAARWLQALAQRIGRASELAMLLGD